MIHTCIIIEDEPMAASLLEGHIQNCKELSLKAIFHTPLDTLTFLQQTQIDIVFLDINLPLLNGMQLAKLLRNDQKIVFTTAYSEYALEGYEHNAIDYLLKPITFERFMVTVRKINTPRTQHESVTDESSIYIKSGKTIIQLQFDEIIFIEGLKDYVMIHTAREKIVTYKRMKDLEELLPEQFSRIHLSYIINRKKISKIEDNHVYINDHRFSISDSYRQAFNGLISRRTL